MMSDHESGQTMTNTSDPTGGTKRSRPLQGDTRYPRKRSLKACHVCRSRKTKCDNVQPTCGFCASLNIRCSYDGTDKDHSSFDPATIEILRQLGKITESQNKVLQTVRDFADSNTRQLSSEIPPSSPGFTHSQEVRRTVNQNGLGTIPEEFHDTPYDWIGLQPDSVASTSAVSANIAAARWFDVLTNDAPREALFESFIVPDEHSNPLDLPHSNGDNDLSPLQRATRIVDKHPQRLERSEEFYGPGEVNTPFEDSLTWQAAESISLLKEEQVLFENFLHGISSWLEPFDLARTFSTRVPHLAIRNAGLLNAILALSSYHLSLKEAMDSERRAEQRTALQYYYQTLHYVQKAMQYSSYRNSLELMATTMIVSTYEMLHDSSNDWQRHLRGVFGILRSRQIEVEVSSLESTTWWAWLQQDIWVAFREKRRTYSTWKPKKACSELRSDELAARALWNLAQVVNFCALESTIQADVLFQERRDWADQLKSMLREWQSCLTIEFSPLPAMNRDSSGVFEPHLIHPQSYGLAMQVFHVSQILICANEPSSGGVVGFLKRQSLIQISVEMVCGIGLTLTDNASSILASQCIFIAGLFTQQPQQRSRILELLDTYRKRCTWPLTSLSSELEQIWKDPDRLWDNVQ